MRGRSKSTVNISKLAAKLAKHHHENWDGSGYPEGLSGNNIPIEARIMAVVDVFDALGSKRCYKEAWTDDKIKALLIAEKDKKFDGALIDIVIDNFDQQGCDLKALFALPIAAIKVSAALFDDAKTEQETKTFLENLIDSANHNNIAVIAERIESKDTLEIVKQLDVKYAQGFYFRHPMPNTD